MKERAERLSRIAELWGQGLTTKAIGERLGIPKNSICGLAFAARREGDMRFPVREKARAARPIGVPFFELWADGCRWDVNVSGVGPFSFCNAAQAVGSYCAEHGSRAFNSAAAYRSRDRIRSSAP